MKDLGPLDKNCAEPFISSQRSNGLLNLTSVRAKLGVLEEELDGLLQHQKFAPIPLQPGRDLKVCLPSQMPAKGGLSESKGQARMLHDLANIELQALELCVRTLIEFPEASQDFRLQLADIAFDEGRHLRACLDTLEEMQCPWGSYPVHLGLWGATDQSDDLIDRILIVHRYLEGAGLDAGHRLLNRLQGVKDFGLQSVVQLIHDEELGHVQFGSTWFQFLARQKKMDADLLFRHRMFALKSRLPRRLERFNQQLRLRAGFTQSELSTLDEIQAAQKQSY